MATSTIVVPDQGAADQDLIDVATAAKADIEGFEGSSLSDDPPAALGGAEDDGSASTASKSDHVHAWAKKVTHSIDATITGSADTTGTPNTPINVGAALPAGALVVAAVITLTTQAAGGTVSAANLDVGWSGATEALVKDLDLAAVTAAGAKYVKGTSAGSAWTGMPLPAGGKQVTIIVTPTGDKLSALTALAATVDVYYVQEF